MKNSKNKLSITIALFATLFLAPRLSHAGPEVETADDLKQIQSTITPELVESLDGMGLEGMPAIFNAIQSKASAKPNDYIGNWKCVGAAWLGTDSLVHGMLYGQDGGAVLPFSAEIRIRLNEITDQVHAGFRTRMVTVASADHIADQPVINDSLHPVKALSHGIQIVKDSGWTMPEHKGLWPFPEEDMFVEPRFAWIFNCGKFHFPGAQADFLLCQTARYTDFSYDASTGNFTGNQVVNSTLDANQYFLFVSPTATARVETAKPTVVPAAGKHQVDLEIIVQ